MWNLFSYIAICVIVAVLMVATDEDMTSVSDREWLMFAVMAYSAYQAIRKMIEIYKRGTWD
ncbi:MAG TPA: hypothetical protein VI457_15715 [Methylococcaceae bacterium]|nr:hypothetical protein [Methylococcaceae bacterium]